MDLEALLALAQGKRAEIAARRGNDGLVKPPSGKSRWRILPGWRKEAPHVFHHDFGQHWIKDRDGKVVVVYVCEEATYGRECDVCAGIAAGVRASTDDSTLELFKEMNAGRVGIVNAIRLSDKPDAKGKFTPVDGKVVMLSLTQGLLGDFIGTLADRLSEDGINILDLESGRDIIIERTGSGKTNTEYSLKDAANNSPAPEGIMDKLNDIDAYVENEFRRGKAKGIGLLHNNTKALLGSARGGTGLMPPAAAAARLASRPVIEGRVIEHEETDLGAGDAVKAAVAAGATIEMERPVETKAPAKAAVDLDAPMNDDELDKLLAQL